jgi:hypothetical protein
VTDIKEYCFKGCAALKVVYFSISFTSIGTSCFSGCSQFIKEKLPETLISIGSFCFQNCESLSSWIRGELGFFEIYAK